MSFRGTEIKIFSGSSNYIFAQNVASHLGLPLGNAEIKTFNNGEIAVSICESVRNSDCFIVQSICNPVNDNLMELLIMIDAMKRACAARITAVIPYFGYSRLDRKVHAGGPISAKLVADLLTVAGANSILTMDLHSPQIQGFFNIPIDHLEGYQVLASFIKDKIKNHKDHYIVVSPDLGSVTRARDFSKILGVPFAIIDKIRSTANVSKVVNIIGEVKGKKVILIDDIVDTAGTLHNAAKAVIEKGKAAEVIACATHPILSGDAVVKLQNSYIEELYLLDTVPLPQEKFLSKIKVLPTASFFAKAIEKIHG